MTDKPKPTKEEHEEVTRTFHRAVKNMLETPPKPHEPSGERAASRKAK